MLCRTYSRPGCTRLNIMITLSVSMMIYTCIILWWYYHDVVVWHWAKKLSLLLLLYKSQACAHEKTAIFSFFDIYISFLFGSRPFNRKLLLNYKFTSTANSNAKSCGNVIRFLHCFVCVQRPLDRCIVFFVSGIRRLNVKTPLEKYYY